MLQSQKSVTVLEKVTVLENSVTVLENSVSVFGNTVAVLEKSVTDQKFVYFFSFQNSVTVFKK